MPKQTPPTPIRRCLHCNFKTHQRFWGEFDECPICEQVIGYIESTHGGLTRRELRQAQREFEKITTGSKERL